MTATEQTIQDAIEGGWENRHYNDYKMEAFRVKHYQDCWIDPKFWQAVGKTRGWNNSQYFSNMYKRKWHKFIDYLADGKTTEEALTELL